MYANELLETELNETAYALDSTTIDLCLSIFPWATFRTTKAAVKMHTLLDLRGSTGLDALTVCGLYKSRWQVELFFKWVKQHLPATTSIALLAGPARIDCSRDRQHRGRRAGCGKKRRRAALVCRAPGAGSR